MPVSKISAFKAGAIGNVFRCSIVAVDNTGQHINTFYVRQVAAAFSGDIFADIFATWDGAIKSTYLACFSANLSLQAFRVSQVDDNLKGLPSETLTATGLGTRTVSGDGLPGQCAGLLEFNTGFSGRKGRGRNFMGDMYEGDQTNGIVGSTLRTLYEAYGDDLMNTFDAGSAVAEHVVFTKVDNTVARVTSTQAKLPVYTQRRRREGVGS